MAQGYCAAPDCVELAKRGGYCWTHYAWVRADKPLTAPKNMRKNGMDAFERLTEAAITYAEKSDCPSCGARATELSDAGFQRASDNLRKAAESYVTKLWRARAREAQQKAKRRGKHIGRPKATFTGTSRWARWRRERFRQVIEGAGAE